MARRGHLPLQPQILALLVRLYSMLEILFFDDSHEQLQLRILVGKYPRPLKAIP